MDKSVVKLWKDRAEGRSYWLAAIVDLTVRNADLRWATQWGNEGQAKKFSKPAQSLVDSGFQLFDLPPDCVDGAVDNVRAYRCKPRSMGR